jgi:Domain of unknown function (DUF4200)
VVPYTLVLEHVSPATRLLEKRRQMFEVQEALEQQKQEFARKVKCLPTPVMISIAHAGVAPPPHPKLAQLKLCRSKIPVQKFAGSDQLALNICQLLPPMQEELFKRREDSLRRKDVELQESLIKFSKFLQENDSKRTRALKKAADEHKICLEKEQEHEQLLATIERLKQEKDRVSAALEKNIKCVFSEGCGPSS